MNIKNKSLFLLIRHEVTKRHGLGSDDCYTTTARLLREETCSHLERSDVLMENKDLLTNKCRKA